MRHVIVGMLLAIPAVAQAAPTVWVTHATVKIQPSDAPGTSTSASISAAQNEFEAFQVAVNGGASGATGVSVNAPTLTGPGGATIPAANVRLYREALITTTYASNQEVSPGTWPDALIPDVDEIANEKRNAFPFDVPANENRVVWVDVLVPANATPGTYTGTLQVVGDAGLSVDVPVTLTVWPFALPSTASLPSTFGLGWDTPCLAYYAQGYNDPRCGDSGVEQLRIQWTQFFLDHRITVDQVYTGPNPSGGSYDWTTWDALYGPLFDGTANTRLAGAKVTTIRYSWGASSTDYGAWASHFRQKGWFDRTYDYTCDEPPNGCAFTDIPGRVANVRAGDPEFRTLVTTNIDDATTNDVLSDITMMTPIINEMDDKSGSFAGSQRASYDAYVTGGNTLFWYQSCESIGCSSGSGAKSYSAYSTGWPSMMIDTPAMRNRAMEWLSFAYQMQGELYYGTGIAIENGADPYQDQWFFGGNGDGTLVYPGTTAEIGGSTDIPVASMRMKLIREGMEDYEYLKLVSDLGDPTFAQQEAATVVQHPYAINDDPSVMYAARTALAQRIIQLQNTSTACSDGTAANACSTTLPQQCVGGALVSACATCGCLSGQSCQADGTCSATTSGAYSIDRVAHTPTIDGQFSEYEGMPQLAMGSSNVQAAWDNANLYLAFDVADDDLVPSDGTEANDFNGDAVEVMIDPDGDGGATAGASDVHVIVDVAGHVSDATAWTNYAYDVHALVAVDLEGGTLGQATTARGYRVEMAIPWTSLGVSPSAGTGFGFDVAIDDKTLAGALTSTDWMGLSAFNHPSAWGHVTLSESGPTTTSTSGSSGSTGSTSSTGTSGSTSTGGAGSTTTGGSATGGGGSTGSVAPTAHGGCSSGNTDVALAAFMFALGWIRRRTSARSAGRRAD